MRTILDNARSWFLESLIFDKALRVVVVEGIRSDEPDDMHIGGHVIRNAYAVAPTPNSRQVAIRFSRIVAWQVVDESFTTADASEVRDDDGMLRILTKSAYMDYIKAHHGWFEDVVGPALHYQLLTEDAIVDVISLVQAVVELLDA